MGKNKIGLHFTGFEELIANLEQAGGDVKMATADALVESQKYVADQAHIAMVSHHNTGDTEKSIVQDGRVTWSGLTAEIDIGFDLSNGGMPSIFLMYGTPRMNKDTKLYNALYGSKTKKAVGKIQEELIQNVIKERLG